MACSSLPAGMGVTLYPLVHKSSLGSQLLLSQEARKETLQDSPGQTLSSCTSFPTLAQSCGQGGQAGAGASPQRRTGKPGLLQALQGRQNCVKRSGFLLNCPRCCVMSRRLCRRRVSSQAEEKWGAGWVARAGENPTSSLEKETKIIRYWESLPLGKLTP